VDLRNFGVLPATEYLRWAEVYKKTGSEAHSKVKGDGTLVEKKAKNKELRGRFPGKAHRGS